MFEVDQSPGTGGCRLHGFWGLLVPNINKGTPSRRLCAGSEVRPPSPQRHHPPQWAVGGHYRAHFPDGKSESQNRR